MSNNAPDYENDLVFAPSMPRCDIDELKAKISHLEKMRDITAEYVYKLEEKLRIAEKALENIASDKGFCFLSSEKVSYAKKMLKKIKE